ncbi:prepilin-type N-terminal cleavage/methylation domain-containing protein [Planctomycetota bacterium]|nr:prepilin-type N-terminal cleavage/methylation domain-containing protein [Planctomycetota bacterium]
MSIRSRKGFTLVELMVVIGILGLLVGILAVAVIPRMTEAKKRTEVVQVGKLMDDIQMISSDPTRKKRMNTKDVKDASGYRWYSIALKKKVLSGEMLTKIVSQNSADTPATTSFFDSDEELDPLSCSYTAPKGSDIHQMLNLRGKDRKVFLTFNTRNWNNYDGDVIVRWTDGQVAEYMNFIDLSDEDDITREDWETGQGITGEKAPFDKTHDGNQ